MADAAVSTSAQYQPSVTTPPHPTGPGPAAQQARAQYYGGYYGSRYYNYGYGVNTPSAQTPHQFSQTVEVEKKQRPIYIAIASIIILVGLVLIGTAFVQPKLDPALKADIQESPTEMFQVVVFCSRCEDRLAATGATIIAGYPTEGAVLIQAPGSKILDLEKETWVTRIGKPQ